MLRTRTPTASLIAVAIAAGLYAVSIPRSLVDANGNAFNVLEVGWKPRAWLVLLVLQAVFLLAFLAAHPAFAADGWHGSRDDGLAAAKQSGKPVLVVTAWKEKV